jgi:hypothetical protein
MTSCFDRRLAVLTAVLLCGALTGSMRAQGPDLGTEAQREAGKKLYAKYCSQCHGEKGDGEGYAAAHLRPRPRNFTSGKFKIRTTPNGALPTHQDLVNIIRRGMPYTSMPAWPNFTDQDVSIGVLRYDLLRRVLQPENVPSPFSSERTGHDEGIHRSARSSEDNGCVKATPDGPGDVTFGAALKDDWGRCDPRGGSRAELDLCAEVRPARTSSGR